jgi:hypothetical protein
MKTSETFAPKALEEVWEWKEAVRRKTRNMSPEESLAFFERAREEAARLLNCRLVKNPDGSYRFVGKEEAPDRGDDGE